jgi:hypothetical protein
VNSNEDIAGSDAVFVLNLVPFDLVPQGLIIAQRFIAGCGLPPIAALSPEGTTEFTTP